jgi:hypothetical protein
VLGEGILGSRIIVGKGIAIEKFAFWSASASLVAGAGYWSYGAAAEDEVLL